MGGKISRLYYIQIIKNTRGIKMKKNLRLVILLGVLALFLAACGGNSDAEESGDSGSGDQIVLGLSIPEPKGAKFDVAAQAFKEKLEELTDNEMSVKVYYSNALGGEKEVFELMGNNSLDMAIQSAGPMVNWVEEISIFDLPYLLDSREHAHAVLDGEIGDELATKFEESANVKVLGWVENGFVATSSNNAINSIEDVEGLKIRVQENELQIDTWTAFGAAPTPMAWTEVFTGLQQGVIDGHSNSLATIQTSQIYEVQSHVALLEDRYQPGPIAISKQKFDSLSSEHQEAVLEAAEHTVPLGRQANQDAVDAAHDFIVENGVEVTKPDKESFKAATESVYEKWAPVIGEELIDRVVNFEY